MWQDGTGFPEPALDQFNQVTSGEALRWLLGGMSFFVALGTYTKLSDPEAKRPYVRVWDGHWGCVFSALSWNCVEMSAALGYCGQSLARLRCLAMRMSRALTPSFPPASACRSPRRPWRPQRSWPPWTVTESRSRICPYVIDAGSTQSGCSGLNWGGEGAIFGTYNHGHQGGYSARECGTSKWP